MGTRSSSTARPVARTIGAFGAAARIASTQRAARVA